MDAYIPGGGVDALPTLGMARCLEEEFQECENSHAAHLAYGDFEPRTQAWPRYWDRWAASAVLRAPSWTSCGTTCGLRASITVNKRSGERGAGSREQEAIDPHPRPLSRDQRSVGARRGEQELEKENGGRKMSVLLAPIFPIFLSFIFLSVPLLNGTSHRQRDRQQAASGYRLSGPCLRIRYASRRDHLPWNGPGRTVAWPDLAMCVAAALGQTDDETSTTVKLPSAEGTVRVIVVPQAVPAPVVSRVSDRLGACRPASVRDSSLHVLCTPRALSRRWESSPVRRT